MLPGKAAGKRPGMVAVHCSCFCKEEAGNGCPALQLLLQDVMLSLMHLSAVFQSRDECGCVDSSGTHFLSVLRLGRWRRLSSELLRSVLQTLGLRRRLVISKGRFVPSSRSHPVCLLCDCYLLCRNSYATEGCALKCLLAVPMGQFSGTLVERKV